MAYPELDRCIEIIQKLHHPSEGCPWDLEQTHRSLLPYLIEEAYEFIDAVESGQAARMEEELGDVLLQVLHHAVMAEADGKFSLESVAKLLADKMVRRHPHVFGEKQSRITAHEVTTRWQQIKGQEKSEQSFVMNEKLLHAPALKAAEKIGKKSTTVNFDWEDHLQVIGKVEEEWQEVKEELSPTGQFNRERVQEEIGDLLFSVAQLARHLEIDPEECLRLANKKFIRRFQSIEQRVAESGKELSDCKQEELERLWIEAKGSR
jgi:MazG family protein